MGDGLMDSRLNDWWLIGGWMQEGGIEGRRQGRREGECGSKGPQAKRIGANLGRVWLYVLLTWLYHLPLYVFPAFSPISLCFKAADRLPSNCWSRSHNCLQVSECLNSQMTHGWTWLESLTKQDNKTLTPGSQRFWPRNSPSQNHS